MLIQVYVHTWKYCSQNTTTLETRSHVQYDTIRKDRVRWQRRHREEPAGVAERVQIATKTHCGGRAAMPPSRGHRGRASSGREEARGSREGPDGRRKVWCETSGCRAPAAHGFQNASQVFGFSDSMCLAPGHLPRDSGIEAGSAAARAGESTRQELRGPSAGPGPEPLVSHPCAWENTDQMGPEHGCWGPGGFLLSKFHMVCEEGRVP